MHVFRTLGPKISLLTHAILQILWLVSIALISRKLSGMVLSHTCTLSTWQTDMGVMVCQIYKALYTFIVLSAASLAANLALDVAVWRQSTSRGAYREMKDGDSQYYGAVGGGNQPAWQEKERTGAQMAPAHTTADAGYRRGFSLDMKQESPDLGYDLGDSQRLVAGSPDPGYTPMQTPRM